MRPRARGNAEWMVNAAGRVVAIGVLAKPTAELGAAAAKGPKIVEARQCLHGC